MSMSDFSGRIRVGEECLFGFESAIEVHIQNHLLEQYRPVHPNR